MGNRKIQFNIIKGKGPMVFFGIILALGIMLVLIILLMILAKEELSTQTQIVLVTAMLIEIFALVISFSIVKIRSGIIKIEKSNKIIEQTYDETKRINSVLRNQRHNFLNHIQVIHGLMEMKQYEEACSYMEKIFKEIQAVGELMKTSCPSINALLQAKYNTCRGKNIELKVISTTTMQKLGMEPWDLCAVMGNIIDNAIDALEGRQDGKIVVIMKEEIRCYIIKIKDNGPGIPKKILNNIFEEGVTTKKEEGHGIGLSFSKKTMDENNGFIEVHTGEKGTVFTITILKNIDIKDN